MPLTPEQQKERRIAMFGFDNIEEYFLNNCGGGFCSANMAATCILSDVQELLTHDPMTAEARERARQWVNVAKWIINNKLPLTAPTPTQSPTLAAKPGLGQRRG